MGCLLTLCSEASFVQLLSNWVGYFVAFLSLFPSSDSNWHTGFGVKASFYRSALTWAGRVSFWVDGVGAPGSHLHLAVKELVSSYSAFPRYAS